MCDVATLTLAALGFAAGSFNHAGQKEYANQLEWYEYNKAVQQNNYILETSRSANAAYIDDMKMLGIREQQESAATAQKIQQSELEARQESASALATSASAGVTGLSVDSLMYDFYRQDAMNRFVATENLNNMGYQIDRQRDSSAAEAMNRVNSIQRYLQAPVDQPSAVNNVLSGVSTGLSFANALPDETKVPLPKPSKKSGGTSV